MPLPDDLSHSSGVSSVSFSLVRQLKNSPRHWKIKQIHTVQGEWLDCQVRKANVVICTLVWPSLLKMIYVTIQTTAISASRTSGLIDDWYRIIHGSPGTATETWDTVYCTNWVISKDSVFACPAPFVPSFFGWLYNRSCESRSLELSSASFCLSIDWPWTCPWVIHSSVRLDFLHLTNQNSRLAVFYHLPICYKILWFNWLHHPYLFFLLSVFLILIK